MTQPITTSTPPPVPVTRGLVAVNRTTKVVVAVCVCAALTLTTIAAVLLNTASFLAHTRPVTTVIAIGAPVWTAAGLAVAITNMPRRVVACVAAAVGAVGVIPGVVALSLASPSTELVAVGIACVAGAALWLTMWLCTRRFARPAVRHKPLCVSLTCSGVVLPVTLFVILTMVTAQRDPDGANGWWFCRRSADAQEPWCTTTGAWVAYVLILATWLSVITAAFLPLTHGKPPDARAGAHRRTASRFLHAASVVAAMTSITVSFWTFSADGSLRLLLTTLGLVYPIVVRLGAAMVLSAVADGQPAPTGRVTAFVYSVLAFLVILLPIHNNTDPDGWRPAVQYMLLAGPTSVLGLFFLAYLPLPARPLALSVYSVGGLLPLAIGALLFADGVSTTARALLIALAAVLAGGAALLCGVTAWRRARPTSAQYDVGGIVRRCSWRAAALWPTRVGYTVHMLVFLGGAAAVILVGFLSELREGAVGHMGASIATAAAAYHVGRAALDPDARRRRIAVGVCCVAAVAAVVAVATAPVTPELAAAAGTVTAMLLLGWLAWAAILIAPRVYATFPAPAVQALTSTACCVLVLAPFAFVLPITVGVSRFRASNAPRHFASAMGLLCVAAVGLSVIAVNKHLTNAAQDKLRKLKVHFLRMDLRRVHVNVSPELGWLLHDSFVAGGGGDTQGVDPVSVKVHGGGDGGDVQATVEGFLASHTALPAAPHPWVASVADKSWVFWKPYGKLRAMDVCLCGDDAAAGGAPAPNVEAARASVVSLLQQRNSVLSLASPAPTTPEGGGGGDNDDDVEAMMEVGVPLCFPLSPKAAAKLSPLRSPSTTLRTPLPPVAAPTGTPLLPSPLSPPPATPVPPSPEPLISTRIHGIVDAVDDGGMYVFRLPGDQEEGVLHTLPHAFIDGGFLPSNASPRDVDVVLQRLFTCFAGFQTTTTMNLSEWKHLLSSTKALEDDRGRLRLDVVPDVVYVKVMGSTHTHMRLPHFSRGVELIARGLFPRKDAGAAVLFLLKRSLATHATLDLEPRLLAAASRLRQDYSTQAAEARDQSVDWGGGKEEREGDDGVGSVGETKHEEAPASAVPEPPATPCLLRLRQWAVSTVSFFASVIPGSSAAAIPEGDDSLPDDWNQQPGAKDDTSWLTVSWEQCALLAHASLSGDLHRDAESSATLRTLAPPQPRRVGKGQDLGVSLSLGNVLAVVELVSEFVTNTMLSFRGAALTVWTLGLKSFLARLAGVSFFEDASTLAATPTSPPSTLPSTLFGVLFVACALLAFGFPFVSAPGIRQIREGTFGMSAHVNAQGVRPKAALLSWRNAYVKVLVVWGSVGFLVIMKTLVGVFVCQDAGGYTVLSVDTDTKCYTWLHGVGAVVALAAMGVYHPVATFVQPSFQLTDPLVDIKYDTTWLVGMAQAKLLVAVLAAFFTTEDVLTVYLVAVLLLLATVCASIVVMKPCYVGRVNVARATSAAASAWAAAATLAVHWGLPAVAGLAVLLGGWAACVVVASVVGSRQFGWCSCCRRHAWGAAVAPER